MEGGKRAANTETPTSEGPRNENVPARPYYKWGEPEVLRRKSNNTTYSTWPKPCSGILPTSLRRHSVGRNFHPHLTDGETEAHRSESSYLPNLTQVVSDQVCLIPESGHPAALQEVKAASAAHTAWPPFCLSYRLQTWTKYVSSSGEIYHPRPGPALVLQTSPSQPQPLFPGPG